MRYILGFLVIVVGVLGGCTEELRMAAESMRTANSALLEVAREVREPRPAPDLDRNAALAEAIEGLAGAAETFGEAAEHEAARIESAENKTAAVVDTILNLVLAAAGVAGGVQYGRAKISSYNKGVVVGKNGGSP